MFHEIWSRHDIGRLMAVAAVIPLMISCSNSGNTDYDRPVTSLEIISKNTYLAGSMYWYHSVLFDSKAEFIVLCEVVEVGEPYQSPEEHHTWVDGRLKVDKIVHCKPELFSDDRKISYIDTDGCNELMLGDRILIFMVPYEGQYAIPSWFSTNCGLGHKLSNYGGEGGLQENDFIDLLSKDYAWDINRMSPYELRMWTYVDAYGVAHALIDEREKAQDL